MRGAPAFEPGIPSGRKPGRAKQAAGTLAAELKGGHGIGVQTGAADTFEAIRVFGPTGDLFVSVHEPDEETVVFLAPANPRAELCSVLGTDDEITIVAGIIRQRVGVTA